MTLFIGGKLGFETDTWKGQKYPCSWIKETWTRRNKGPMIL